jgi:hypothetical protein
VVDQALLADEQALQRYAVAHREAVQAAGLVQGPLPEHCWKRVVLAQNRANDELARCDDAWMNLALAGVEMLTRRVQRGQLARLSLVWGPSIRVACRYRGPSSHTVVRMRECRRRIGISDRKLRRVEAARRRMQDAVRNTGRTSAASQKEAWRLADRYGKYVLADELADHLTEIVNWFDDAPEQAGIARYAAELCLELGDVARGRDLYQIYYTVEMNRLTGLDDDLSLVLIAARQQHMADYHLLNGEAARAEALVHTALERLPAQLPGSASPHDVAVLDELRERCLATFADSLLVLGRRTDAHNAYWEAHRHAAEGCATPDQRAARQHLNSAIYTGGQWMRHG